MPVAHPTKDSYFFLSSDPAKDEFVRNPGRYANPDEVHIPAPRIMVTGAEGSGKSSLIQTMNATSRIPVVQFSSFFKAHLKENYSGDELSGYLSQVDGGDDLPSEVITAAVERLYKQEPYRSKGFYCEGFPKTRADVQAIFGKEDLAVDAVWIVRTETESIVTRNSDKIFANATKQDEEDSAREAFSER